MTLIFCNFIILKPVICQGLDHKNWTSMDFRDIIGPKKEFEINFERFGPKFDHAKKGTRNDTFGKKLKTNINFSITGCFETAFSG